MWGWGPRRTKSALGHQQRLSDCKPEPAVGQEAGRVPARPFLGLHGPQSARFEQTRRDEAIKLPGVKPERKQNETSFG